MKNQSAIKHIFVEQFPDKLDEGILYISVKFASSALSAVVGAGARSLRHSALRTGR
jgi:hypothetical protein